MPKAKELQAKRPLHASAASLEERQGKAQRGCMSAVTAHGDDPE